MRGVVCIKNSNSTRIDDYLVIGKVYICEEDIQSESGDSFTYMSDMSNRNNGFLLVNVGKSHDWFPSDWFISIEDYRDVLIDNILG